MRNAIILWRKTKKEKMKKCKVVLNGNVQLVAVW